MTKVFLGGTCNGSTWRNELISMLEIEYFNPVVDDWTPECQEEEFRQKIDCDYCLYVITPEIKGTYSIAEVVDDSNKKPRKTIFCPLKTYNNISFDDDEWKSLLAVKKLVHNNGASVASCLESVWLFLNNEKD